MRQPTLYSLAVLLTSGLLSTAVAAPHAKRVAQSADELVVIPIDDPADQSTQLIPDTAAASGFFKVKRTPQTDELVVIPIDDPVDSAPVNSGASSPGQEPNSNSF